MKELNFKEYIYQNLINKKLRFKCDCSIPLDVTGIVKSFKIVGSDVLIYLETSNKKIVSISANHPNLKVIDFKAI